MTITTRATTSSRWIKLPPMLKPNPRSHKTNNTATSVQSIIFSCPSLGDYLDSVRELERRIQVTEKQHSESPFDLPERLMGADPDYFIQKKLAKTEQGLSFFGKEALADYMRCFRNPATIHAMCEDYRATAGVDLAMDTADLAAGRRIETPLLVLWGATGAVGRPNLPST